MSAGSFAHWSPLQTLLVGVLGTCVAAVVWYAVFYRATHDEWVTVGNELSAAHSDLAAARERKRLADGRAGELDEQAAALARTRAAQPAAEDLIFTVPTLVAELTVDRWRPLAPEPDQPDQPDQPDHAVVRSPVLVDARGTWSALNLLLTRVAALPQIVAVDRLVIRGGVDDELELQLVLGELRLREGAP